MRWSWSSATGAKLKLEPWDGDFSSASLMPIGQFGPVVDLDYMTKGFVQFQMDKDGKLNLLRLSSARTVRPMSSDANVCDRTAQNRQHSVTTAAYAWRLRSLFPSAHASYSLF